jgi:MEMO1 family protein
MLSERVPSRQASVFLEIRFAPLLYDPAVREVRPAAVAGSWYPGTKEQLEAAVDRHLSEAAPARPRSCPRAIIAPHAGLMYSGRVAACAYTLVRQCDYGAAILVGPSHFVAFRGVSIWPRGAWATPLGEVRVAEDLAEAIVAESTDMMEHQAAHGREHSLEMQLPFIARVLPGVPIVPLVMGYQDRATATELGDAIARAVKTRKTNDVLLVASSDLSHYENADTASRLDGVVLDCVEAFDADRLMKALEDEPRHACGGGPMVSVLRAAAQLGCTEARVVRYADSGDVSGDKSSVVGYMAAAAW